MENLKLLAVCIITIIVVLSVQGLIKYCKNRPSISPEELGQKLYEHMIMVNNLHEVALVFTCFQEYVQTVIGNHVDTPDVQKMIMSNLKILVQNCEEYDPAKDDRQKVRID